MTDDRKQFLLAQRLMNGPSIIVVGNVMYATLGGSTLALSRHGGLGSNRHGSIKCLCTAEDCGIVEHRTVGGSVLKWFIPQGQRMYVSNGRFRLVDVNYDSFLSAHRWGTMITSDPKKDHSSPTGRFIWSPEHSCWEMKASRCVEVFEISRSLLGVKVKGEKRIYPFLRSGGEENAFEKAIQLSK